MKSPTTGRLFSAAEECIVNLGFPAVLILNAEERRAVWERNPPKSSHFVDLKLENQRALRDQQKQDRYQIQKAKKLKKLENSRPSSPSQPFSTKGLRWDINYSRWIPDGSTQEDEMPKLIITPYDTNGLVIARGKTSVKEDATSEQIDAQIAHAFRRGGKKVTRVEVTKDGHIVSAHSLLDFGPKLASAAPEAETTGGDAQQPAPEGLTEEADMAKKRKSVKPKKASKGKTEKGYKGHRAGSRKEKAHKLFDELGPEKARPKVLAMGIKAGSINGWFGSFKK